MGSDDQLRSLLRFEAHMIAGAARVMVDGGRADVSIEPMGDGMLVALGPGRWVNRAVGVGPDLGRDEIATIERFYAQAGLPAALQLPSTASGDTISALADAGFRLTSFRGLHAGPPPELGSGTPDGERFRIATVDDDSVRPWLDVLADGNQIGEPETRRISDEYALAARQVEGSVHFLAFDGDRAIGCGSVQVGGPIAWLGGAATLPGYRNRGVQRRLLDVRIAHGAAFGCRTIAATAVPGGSSARNLVRAGLDLIDTQVVLSR